MNPVRLFNVLELRAAYSWVLPPEAAEFWAQEWFRQFVAESEDDATAWFVYQRRTPEESAAMQRQNVIRLTAPTDPADVFRELRSWAPNVAGEDLMHFSSVHLQLLTLVSDELLERITHATGGDVVVARRRRDAIVAALGRPVP